MQHKRLNTTTFCDPHPRAEINGYFLIDEAGKIIFANQQVAHLNNRASPTYIQDLFPLCLPAFEAAFSACLATGSSQARLLVQAPGPSAVEVKAGFHLNALPGNAIQVLLSLQPASQRQPAAAPLAPANKTALPAWDPAFIKGQTLAQIGNFTLDYRSGQVHWTPALYTIFRLPETAPALSYAAFLDRLHPADRPLFLQQSQQATSTHSPLHLQLRILRGDDTTGFIQLTAQSYYDGAGEIRGVMGTVVDISSFKEAEVQLRQALAAVEKVMNYSPDMLLSVDDQGIILHANKAVESMLGYTTAEMIGQHYGLFIEPGDLHRTIEQLTLVNAGFPTHDFHNFCIRKDGSLVPVLWSAFWSEAEQNYFCVGRDGTKLRQAQQQLIASEERFRLLAENGSDMMCLLSARGEYTYVSESTTRILGIPAGQFLGRSPFDFIHPADLPWMQEHFARLPYIDRMLVPPFRLRDAKGEWRWMETIVTNYLDHPYIQGYATTTRDVTQRRQHELEIQESEQRYKSLFEHHPDPVYSLNLAGEFTSANKRVSQLLGCDASTIIGVGFQELILPEFSSDTLAHFSRCCQGEARTYNSAVTGADGKRLDLEVTNIPIIIDGRVTGIYGIAKDITQLKKGREERRQLIGRLEQKNHHLEQFAYIVSHNLRAPVANILGLTNLFNQEDPDHDMNAQVITNLQKSAQDLDAIIHGLNQILSNRDTLQEPQEMVNLNALLASIQQTLKEDIIRSQAVFEADFSALPVIKTVKSFMHNILLSLIRNAIRYKDPATPLRIKMQTHRFENKNCLTIQDNSLNLKRQRNNSFAGFADVDANGEAKGLPWQLIKSQVEALGGKVELDTAPGSGCTFKLYLMN